MRGDVAPIASMSNSAAVLLCRQPKDTLLGVSSARNGIKILVTVQGDGVISYDATRLTAGDSKALGSSQARLLAPVQQLDGSYIAAVQPHGSPHGLLVCTPVASKQPKPLLDAEHQLPLQSTLHSLHILHTNSSSSSSKSTAGCAAVVLADGTVGAADFAEVTIRQCCSSSSSAAVTGSSGKQRTGHGPLIAATCNGQQLAVAKQAAATSAVTVDIYTASSSQAAEQTAAAGPASLQLTHSCTVACPSPSSKLAGISSSAGVVALLWRDGSVTVYHSDLTQRSSTAEHVATFPLPAVLSEAATSAAAGQPAGRKRRAVEDAGGDAAKVLCTLLSDTHLLLVAVQSATQAWHAVLDSRYGCCLASGPIALEAAAAVDEGSSSQTQLLPLPQHADAPAALLAGGAVYLLHIQLPKADLAGLVSRLALSSSNANTSSSAQAAASVTAAAAGRVVTSRQHLNLAALAAAVSSSAATQQQPGTAVCLLHEVPAADQHDSSTDTVAAAAELLSVVLAKQPVPAAELKQVAEQLCAALQQQQQQQQGNGQQQQQQQHAQAAGRRGKHGGSQQQQQQLPLCAAAVLVSQQLLAQGLVALADAQEWALMGQLHQLQPLQSLVTCPSLLPALVTAQQYPLLRQVLFAAQDIPADSLVQAMQQLLLPLAAHDAAAATAAKQQEVQSIRAAAGAAVQAAEAAVASGDVAAAAVLLAVARRAAAAVDGFTASEVLLHALLAAPVDGIEAQAALKSLPTAAVLKLLKQLSKWVTKYSTLALREGCPAISSWDSVGLTGSQWNSSEAQALLATPSWGQVLEWARLVLDAHLTRLALLPAAGPLLQQLQNSLAAEVGAAGRLVLLKGVVDHMAAGGPLPAVAEAANSEYTLELLDLRVAGR